MQSDLADATKIGLSTVKGFEAAGNRKSNYITIQAIQMTLEKAGIEFLGDNGVRLKKK